MLFRPVSFYLALTQVKRTTTSTWWEGAVTQGQRFWPMMSVSKCSWIIWRNWQCHRPRNKVKPQISKTVPNQFTMDFNLRKLNFYLVKVFYFTIFTFSLYIYHVDYCIDIPVNWKIYSRMWEIEIAHAQYFLEYNTVNFSCLFQVI